MTLDVLAPTDLVTGEQEDFAQEFTPATSGVYFFGFHAISDPDMYYLTLSDVSITLAPSANTPGVVTDIVITPNAEGKAQAKLEFTAPAINFAGEPLTSLTGVRIMRAQDGGASELIADVKRNAAPGAEMSFNDVYMTDSTMYTYTFIPYNAEGDGRSAQASKWIGLDYPTAIINPVLTDDNGTGFTLKWDASEAANEGVFFPEKVLYQVCTLEAEQYWFWMLYYPDGLVDEVVGETQYSLTYPMDEGEAWALQLGVLASNEKDANWDYYDSPSNEIYIGAPSVTPVTESFPGGEQEQEIWFTDGYQTEYGYYYYDTNIYLSSESVDGDGGSVDFRTGYADEFEADTMLLKSWKLSLAGTTAPKLVFMRKFASKLAAPAGKLIVKAITAEGNDVEIAAKELTAADEDWVKESFDLSSFIDNRYIWLEFGLAQDGVEGTQDLFVDNIHIGDLYAIDGEVNFTAPESAERGTEVAIDVVVKNNGDEDIESYKVNVTVGDEEVANYTVANKLPSLSAKALSFTYAVDKLEKADVLPVKVTLTVADDMDPSTNVAVGQIQVTSPDLLPVSDLAVAENAEGARVLSWTAPETGGAMEITESCEKGIGGFTTIDADGDGYDWNSHINTGQGNYVTHTGDGSAYSESYSNDLGAALTPDNWLITPRAQLNGTFSFWAAAQSADWADEHFAVFVSTESNTDVSTFTQVSEEFVSTGEMTEYTVDLSAYEGAEGYVAIRHFNCTDMFCLVVDDVTFKKLASGGDIEGYAVYRNSKLIGVTPEVSFVDADALEDGEYTYQVTAIYEDGSESAPVAVLYTVKTDGIFQVLSNGEPFDIYTLDGVKVRQNTTTVSGLNKGVYVINGKKVTLK